MHIIAIPYRGTFRKAGLAVVVSIKVTAIPASEALPRASNLHPVLWVVMFV
jgi:hypothetical protein